MTTVEGRMCGCGREPVLTRNRCSRCIVEREHRRYPKAPRGSFPAHWLLRYGWRRFVAYAPVVAHRCLTATLTLGKHARGFVGIGGWRDDDDELVIEVGLVLVHLSFHVIVFEPRTPEPALCMESIAGDDLDPCTRPDGHEGDCE